MDRNIRQKMTDNFLEFFDAHIQSKDDNAAILFLWDRTEVEVDTYSNGITLLGGGEFDGLVELVLGLLKELSGANRTKLLTRVMTDLLFNHDESNTSEEVNVC